MSIYSTFKYFNTLLSHPDTFETARKDPRYFTRDSKLGLSGLLKLLFSRQGYIVTNEINHYFSSYDLEKSISKQAVFQAQGKLNYMVFPFINKKLCRYYYRTNEYETLKGYTVIAIDGSVGEAPYTKENEKYSVLPNHSSMTAILKHHPEFQVFMIY
ncbi:hypothetical protein [Thomasclavelia spiroformis]|uniref:hypothetical protein n=1 Tax=Thomasclavelia spiroformis TaxID=29348 RepID=UPI003991B498